MTFTPPAHTPVQWQNAPSTATPLDSTHLEAAETDLVDYTQSALAAYDAYAQTQPGSLLVVVEYSPATQTTWNMTTTLTVLDTVNATISFVVPASGKFWVDVGIDWGVASDGTHATDVFIALLTHGTGSQVGAAQSIGGTNLAGGVGGHGYSRHYCTGVTPGALQLDLAGGISSLPSGAYGFLQAQAIGAAITTDPTSPLTLMVFAA